MLNLLSTLSPSDVHVAMICELKRGKTGSRRVGKHRYPRAQFGYGRYKDDPRPDVLVLGDWRHPSTKNHLRAGINLNYLSPMQIDQLRKVVDRVFNKKSLRSRYRFLKSKLPDVAQYYRTYDTEYIHSWQPDELESYHISKRKPKEPEPEDEKTKEAADFGKLKNKIEEPEPEPDDNEDDLVDTEREVWRLRRQMYDPESGKRNKPERAGIRGSKLAKKSKRNRYRRQRKKLRELEQQAELERMKAELDKEQAEEEPEEEQWPSQAELGDVYESKDLYYSPRFGFSWLSPKSYIRYHQPEQFRPMMESCPGRPLAIYNLKSGEFVIDTVNYYHVLAETGWDFDDSVCLEVIGEELVVKFECAEEEALRATSELKERGIIELLVESQR